MTESLTAVVTIRVLLGLISSIINNLVNIGLVLWDSSLTAYNAVAPARPANKVVPEGRPGAGGLWPQYAAPKNADSRSACPALNALANHGILPHSGRAIPFRDLYSALRSTYNFSPSFCFYVPRFAAQMLNKDYWTDSFDLSDLSAHNCIEHDASLTREDTYHVSDQSKPSPSLVKDLLARGTGPAGDLTIADLSHISGQRRVQAKRTNGQFSLSTFHKMFGSCNSSTLLTIFGGRVKDLRPFLVEERLPDGWQPRVRSAMGLTFLEFNATVLQVELGIREEAQEALGAWAKVFAGDAENPKKGKKVA